MIYRDIKRNRNIYAELPRMNEHKILNSQERYLNCRTIHRKIMEHSELEGATEDRMKVG